PRFGGGLNCQKRPSEKIMQNSVIHIVKELEGAGQVESQLRFTGFIHYLQGRRSQEKTMRVKYLDFVIPYFEQRLQGKHLLELDEVGQYGDLLELMYASIFPAVADEHEYAWALGVPVTPTLIYGTDLFYDELRDPVTKEMRA